MPMSVRRPSLPPSSMSSTLDELTETLARHISRITVTSMIEHKLHQRSMNPWDLGPENVVEFIEDLMVGLRLFCDPERLPDLMIDLATLCDRVLFGEPPPPRSLRPPPLPKIATNG
jgi:hypothetical protein